MTIDWRRYGWQPGCTAVFFAIGVPYWQIPYNKVNLPDALPGSMVLRIARSRCGEGE